jgi:uncharacterized membrane protein (DUF485 family)
MATVSILGGTFALRRRIWGLALAGAVLAFISAIMVGIFLAIFWVMTFLNILGSLADDPSITTISSAQLSTGLIIGFAIFLILLILAIVYVIQAKGEFK